LLYVSPTLRLHPAAFEQVLERFHEIKLSDL
jgi:hypothetical protein